MKIALAKQNDPLAGLDSVFAEQVEELNRRCLEKGIVLCLLEGLRSPNVQGNYWAKSRTNFEIKNMKDQLCKQGANFLAECIPSINIDIQQKVTNAIPGYSWHQWGEAVDMVWVIKNKPYWDTDKLVGGVNGNQVYAEQAAQMGLECGMFWSNLKDPYHVQMRKQPSPSIYHDVISINDKMKEQFGLGLNRIVNLSS